MEWVNNVVWSRDERETIRTYKATYQRLLQVDLFQLLLQDNIIIATMFLVGKVIVKFPQSA